MIASWNEAYKAVQKYGGSLEAIKATQKEINALNEDTIDNNSVIGTINDYDTSGGVIIDQVKEIINKMKSNANKYGSESEYGKSQLSQENIRLGNDLQNLIGRPVIRGDDGVWYLDRVGGAQLFSTYPYNTYHSGDETEERIRYIIEKMKSNGAKYSSESESGKKNLSQENIRLGNDLQNLIGRPVIRGDDGVWYLDKVGGQKLFSTYPYNKYHNGGIVGKESNPEQNEMFALLKKGEAVLTEQQQKVAYRILDTSEMLMNKLGIGGGLYHSMNGTKYAEIQSNKIMRDMDRVQTMYGNKILSQSIGDITLPVHISVTEKLDKSDIKRLSNEISSVAAEGIASAFIKRGKGTLRDSLLKP